MSPKATKSSNAVLKARSIPSVFGETLQFVLSPDGSMLGSVGVCSDMRIYDTKTWELRTAFKLGETIVSPVHVLRFSPDGKKLYEITEDHVRRFSIPKPGEEIKNDFKWNPLGAKRHPDWIEGRAISPDCKKVLLCGEGHIAKICDSQTGKILDEYSFKNDRYVLFCPVFSPDGKHVVMANNSSKIFVLDLENKATQEFPMSKGRSFPLNWSPDGKLILIGNGKKLLFVDAANGKTVREIAISKGDVVYATLSSNGKVCLLGVISEETSSLQFVQVESKKVVFEKLSKSNDEFFFSPAEFVDKDTRLAIGGTSISIHDAKSTNLIKTIEGQQGRLHGFLFTSAVKRLSFPTVAWDGPLIPQREKRPPGLATFILTAKSISPRMEKRF